MLRDIHSLWEWDKGGGGGGTGCVVGVCVSILVPRNSNFSVPAVGGTPGDSSALIFPDFAL